MLKKALLVLCVILSQQVFAEANTSAQQSHAFDRIPSNKDTIFSSNHSYTVSNNTPEKQSISVCFDLVVCPDSPTYIKNTRDCRAFELNPYETKSDKKSINVTVNYPFRGWCSVVAQTETTGGSYSKSRDEHRFEVKPL